MALIKYFAGGKMNFVTPLTFHVIFTGSVERPKHQGPGPGRGVHVLLSEQSRLREEGESAGQNHGWRVGKVDMVTIHWEFTRQIFSFCRVFFQTYCCLVSSVTNYANVESGIII